MTGPEVMLHHRINRNTLARWVKIGKLHQHQAYNNGRRTHYRLFRRDEVMSVKKGEPRPKQ